MNAQHRLSHHHFLSLGLLSLSLLLPLSLHAQGNEEPPAQPAGPAESALIDPILRQTLEKLPRLLAETEDATQLDSEFQALARWRKLLNEQNRPNQSSDLRMRANYFATMLEILLLTFQYYELKPEPALVNRIVDELQALITDPLFEHITLRNDEAYFTEPHQKILANALFLLLHNGPTTIEPRLNLIRVAQHWIPLEKYWHRYLVQLLTVRQAVDVYLKTLTPQQRLERRDQLRNVEHAFLNELVLTLLMPGGHQYLLAVQEQCDRDFRYFDILPVLLREVASRLNWRATGGMNPVAGIDAMFETAELRALPAPGDIPWYVVNASAQQLGHVYDFNIGSFTNIIQRTGMKLNFEQNGVRIVGSEFIEYVNLRPRAQPPRLGR